MICGFVALEMYKVHSIVPKKCEDFRSCYINLAFNLYSASEPVKCHDVVCPANNEKCNLWTTWEIEGDVTVGEFIDQAKKKYNIDVESIIVGNFYILNFTDPPKRKEQKLKSKITDILVNELKQQPLNDGQLYVPLIVTCVDDIETPVFRLKVK